MKPLKAISFILSLFAGQLAMAQSQEITDLTTAYLGIKDALAADDAESAGTQAESFVRKVEAVSNSKLDASQEKIWSAQEGILLAGGKALSSATDLGGQRAQLNGLSIALYALLKASGANEGTVYYQYCPMKKAYWLSDKKEIQNPYYGKKMLSCGSTKETLN